MRRSSSQRPSPEYAVSTAESAPGSAGVSDSFSRWLWTSVIEGLSAPNSGGRGGTLCADRPENQAIRIDECRTNHQSEPWVRGYPGVRDHFTCLWALQTRGLT